MVSASYKKGFVIVGLFFAAGFMVLAWIAHLKVNPSFLMALLMSFAFVIPEYIMNTYFTRYSEHNKLFNPGQLGIISIISGLIFIFIVNTLLFKETPNGDDAMGFILVAIGGVLILKSDKFPGKDLQGLKNAKSVLEISSPR